MGATGGLVDRLDEDVGDGVPEEFVVVVGLSLASKIQAGHRLGTSNMIDCVGQCLLCK